MAIFTFQAGDPLAARGRSLDGWLKLFLVALMFGGVVLGIRSAVTGQPMFPGQPGQAEMLSGAPEASLEASWPSRFSRVPQETRSGENGALIFVGQISLTFAPTATVRDANEALAKVGGRVVQSSTASQRRLEVLVARGLSEEAACRLLAGHPGVVSVQPRVLAPQENPLNRR